MELKKSLPSKTRFLFKSKSSRLTKLHVLYFGILRHSHSLLRERKVYLIASLDAIHLGKTDELRPFLKGNCDMVPKRLS